MNLGSAGNTEGPALYILEEVKQYTVLCYCSDDSDYVEWIAVKDGNRFVANSADELLGLVCIYEIVGEDWNKYSSYDREHIYERDLSDYFWD